jgi:hypothetical protein
MTLELARKRRSQSDLIHELVDGLEWDAAVLMEVIEKSEPAGEGWFKIPPGVLTTLGELEIARCALIEKAKQLDPDCEEK